MKNILLILAVVSMSLPALAVGPAPKELQGGVITVTLKDGKTYTFSSDEYAVVKRGSKTDLNLADAKEKKQTLPPQEDVYPHKNIISVGLVRSQNGFNIGANPNTISIETRDQIGGQIQYQRRVDKTVYLGGQIDTNGGFGANVGAGF